MGWLRKYDPTLGNIDSIIEGICINPRDAATICYYYHCEDNNNDDGYNNNDMNITSLLLNVFQVFSYDYGRPY